MKNRQWLVSVGKQGSVGDLRHVNMQSTDPKLLAAERGGGHRSRLLGCLLWISSVLVTAALLASFLGPSFASSRTGHMSVRSAYPGTTSDDIIIHPRRVTEAPSPRLSRRAECQSGGADVGSDDMALRIGAIFIILAVSSFACAFPILVVKLPGLRMPADFFFAVRHFGTGVLIATAFVHLLPTAFTLLGDPCLSDFWTEDYPAMPGAIALAAIFLVTIVEMLLHPARSRLPERAPANPVSKGGPGLQGRSASIGRSLSNIGRRPAGDGDGDDDGGALASPSPPSACEPERGIELAPEAPTAPIPALTPEQIRKKEIMHVLLLEMGILFHSVFIGMALSVSIGGNEFVILLIAISFHQTFEGLALGSRIAGIEWPKGSLRPIAMAIAYGCTTPIGQALGLAARSAYSPESAVGLILVGVMNAISSGLLAFASLVELLSEDLLSDESWRTHEAE
ncbi:hypothetical protein DL766_002210 [Monosporascus sp. MC13-8B]|uniref:Zinc/iron permease n=1 Tax=Monosporascus cannonballus TaxID=155416 RepID=A0ABY0GV78_9PEZI|nr:hypothetical protein DL762_010501 [Monosporascus cannonballus]RYO80590.1 hypothetical protein DL763_008856 [Monosporascus cannonballus]RYP36028.1 hypothetical protein DL766_002210 [Monosporascus sp. MC13-8B]